MNLKLYDTLVGKVVDFQPAKAGEVSIYACGPTVYDVPHLGHARTAITYDVISRYLEWAGNKVCLVSNITDIDDKIIARAAEEKTTELELAERYLKIYNEQMAALKIRPPDRQPRATEYVTDPKGGAAKNKRQGMISIITELVDGGAAYIIEGLGVYFDVTKYSDYGRLVHRTPKDLEESGQGRIEPVEGKKNPLDFALWKAAKKGEPEWEAPWMPGRPGWHIECVAMSLGELGDGFDIHGGGSDLIFPHHENERAEACSLGKQFARHWVHSGMVNINGEKMAKSQNNFVNINQMLETISPEAFRLALLQTHYRSILEIDDDTLAAATAGISRIKEMTRLVRNSAAHQNLDEIKFTQDATPLEEYIKPFREAMENDFSTPAAVALIFDLVRDANKAGGSDEQRLLNFMVTLSEMLTALGIVTESPAAKFSATSLFEISNALNLSLGGASHSKFSDEIKELIKKREDARAESDYETSDQLRDELLSLGVQIQDHPDAPTEYI